MNTIAKSLKIIQKRIDFEVKKNLRPQNSVKLLAVSKQKPSLDIRAVYEVGQRDFGENYLQEALLKIEELKELDITWHYIGKIQSNKTALIAKNFSWVQTVDSLKIAKRLSTQRPKDLSPLNICIQINISGSNTKSGIAVDEVIELAENIKNFANIKLRGIMAIPTSMDNLEKLKDELKQLQLIFAKLKQMYQDIDTMSVGMSEDLELAIASGTTMVRVGSAIFGKR